MRRLLVSIVWFIPLIAANPIQGGEPFVFRGSRETVHVGFGAAVFLAGTYFHGRVVAMPLDSLRIESLFPPDRFAVRYHSSAAGRVSDGLAVASAGLPLLFMSRGTARTDGILVLEATLISQGITRTLKGLCQRPRPYAYATDRRRRIDSDAFRSFPSGHTAAAFNGAVLAGILSDRRGSNFPPVGWVWASGLAAASATAFCRVASGNHFPTDVLAGAVIGASVGWLVPRLHHRR
jgi:membrane-associated phospholipid phosphatase